jgi:hypothetical protein
MIYSPRRPACMLLRVPIVHQACMYPVTQVVKAQPGQQQPPRTCLHVVPTIPVTILYMSLRGPRHPPIPLMVLCLVIQPTTPELREYSLSVLEVRLIIRAVVPSPLDLLPARLKLAELLHLRRVAASVQSPPITPVVKLEKGDHGNRCST